MKEKDKEDRGAKYHASDLPAIINDITLGREPRFPADTLAKKKTIESLKKEIAEAKAKGYTTYTPE